MLLTAICVGGLTYCHEQNFLVGAVAVIIVVVGIYFVSNQEANGAQIKIGFIGPMTGSGTKYGSFEAVNLAVEEINNAGGIKGKQIMLVAEDGKCDAKEAVSAANKLINVDNVKVILGGHCTPESVAIAPIVEKAKVVMLASITTTPLLTTMGDYVFRTSPVSVVQSTLVADTAVNKMGLKKMAIIYEQSDYTRPIAEKLKDEVAKLGGEVAMYEAFTTGITDFRTLITKAKAEKVDSLFLSSLTPDAILSFMKQAKELGLKAQLFGNDTTGNQAVIDQIPSNYEGFIFGSPEFNPTNPKTVAFTEKYKAKYNTKNLPYGIWTAESYDAVYLVKKCIEDYGQSASDIQGCLYKVKDFEGASGKVSIDSNGDGIRTYTLKTVKGGVIGSLSN